MSPGERAERLILFEKIKTGVAKAHHFIEQYENVYGRDGLMYSINETWINLTSIIDFIIGALSSDPQKQRTQGPANPPVFHEAVHEEANVAEGRLNPDNQPREGEVRERW